MKIIFVSITNAQLMNVLAIVKENYLYRKCVLFCGGIVKKYIDNQILKKYFFEIYVLPEISSKIKILDLLKKSIFWKNILNDISNDFADCERIFISGISINCYLLYYAIKNKNSNVRLSIYEEGICEYYNYNIEKKIRKLYSKFVFGCYYPDLCDSLYVYRPEAVSLKYKNIILKKIAFPNMCKELLDDLNNIFGYRNGKYIKTVKKIIFNDVSYNFLKNRTLLEKQQKEFLEKIIEIAGNENVCVKLHPRSKENKYGRNINYLEIDGFFELMLMNENLSENIFISTCSSTMVTPKFMLDIEVPSIVLQKIINNKENEITKLFERVKRTYSQNLFFLPKTEEELKENLLTLLDIVGDKSEKP